jgi:glucose 1-dehydrogenase
MVKRLGTIDILVNNAGLQCDSPFQDMTLAQWNMVISVNLTGQFLCARAAIIEFLRRGVRPEVSSSAALARFA